MLTEHCINKVFLLKNHIQSYVWGISSVQEFLSSVKGEIFSLCQAVGKRTMINSCVKYILKNNHFASQVTI